MNKEFLYSDLFKLLPQAFKVSKSEFNEHGKTPAYSSDTRNNGCLGYVDREPLYYVTEDCPVYLVFGDHTKTMNIVHRSFCVMDNVKVLLPIIKMSDQVLLFITTVWKKSIPDLGYARHWSVAKIAKISLPVIEHADPNHEYTVDDIDWQYMEDRIKELEEDRIKELDAYLKVTNLDDYELTDEDEKVLSLSRKSTSNENGSLETDCQNGTLRFKRFIMHDIFEPLKVTKAKKSEVRNFKSSEFCVPVVYAKFGDNGIMYWGRKDQFTTYENVISIVYNGAIAAGKVYAQEEPTGILAESYFIQYKYKRVPVRANLYMAQVIEHKIYPIYSRENLAIWNGRVENEIIYLPVTPDGEPDFDYMERYIRAIEKLTIADVVKYKDKVIDTTKMLVNSQS